MNEIEAQKVIEEIHSRFASEEQTIEDLEIFLAAKEAYIREESLENRVSLQISFGNIYEDIKIAWYGHWYTKETFELYVEALRYFPEDS